jgi:hypothetical protein
MKRYIVISLVIFVYAACTNNNVHDELSNGEAKSIILEMCFPDYFDTSFNRYVEVYGQDNWLSHKIYTNKNDRIIDTFELDCFPLSKDSFPLFELRIDTIYKNEIISYDQYYENIFASSKAAKKKLHGR